MEGTSIVDGQYLTVGLGAIAAALAYFLWVVHRMDPTRGAPPPRIPSHPDPYEIAFLRGGAREVVRVALADLMQRGYVHLREEGGPLRRTRTLEKAARHPDVALLPDVERAIFNGVSGDTVGRTILRGISQTVAAHCQRYEDAAARDGLLTELAHADRVRAARRIVEVAVIAVGGFALFSTLFSSVMGVLIAPAATATAGIIAYVILERLLRAPRLSHRGRAYLAQLREVYVPNTRQPRVATAGAPSLLLIALVGSDSNVDEQLTSHYHMVAHRTWTMDFGDGGGFGGGDGGGGGYGGGDGGGGGVFGDGGGGGFGGGGGGGGGGDSGGGGGGDGGGGGGGGD